MYTHTHSLSLETQVAALGEEARRLQAAHADSSDQIAAKQAEIVGLWEGLKRKASQRSTRLGDALHFQKFLADCWYVFVLVCVSVRESVCVGCPCRELESWVHDMETVIAAVELAKDVASAEATLQGHRERKVQTPTHYNCFTSSVTLSMYQSICACVCLG